MLRIYIRLCLCHIIRGIMNIVKLGESMSEREETGFIYYIHMKATKPFLASSLSHLGNFAVSSKNRWSRCWILRIE